MFRRWVLTGRGRSRGCTSTHNTHTHTYMQGSSTRCQGGGVSCFSLLLLVQQNIVLRNAQSQTRQILFTHSPANRHVSREWQYTNIQALSSTRHTHPNLVLHTTSFTFGQHPCCNKHIVCTPFKKQCKWQSKTKGNQHKKQLQGTYSSLHWQFFSSKLLPFP